MAFKLTVIIAFCRFYLVFAQYNSGQQDGSIFGNDGNDFGLNSGLRGSGSLESGSLLGTGDSLFVAPGSSGSGTREVITVTVVKTVDTFSTITDTFLQSVPVTFTQFVKSTVTVQTRQVLRTAADDVVQLTTVEISRPSTITVTDISSNFICSTEVSSTRSTITHTDQNILRTTVTSTLVATHTFRPVIVRTTILTERETETETIAATDTVWVEAIVTTRYTTKIHPGVF